MDNDTTNLVQRSRSGDRQAADELMPLLYDELRAVARKYFRHNVAQTLQPTALVNEAYCKLVDQHRVSPQDRSHFFALGALALRQAYVDHVRGRDRVKRGGDRDRVPMTIALDRTFGDDATLPEVLDAIEVFSRLDPRAAQVVDLKFFGGLTEKQIAEHLNVSERTVRNDWTSARAWLRKELADEES